MKMDNSEIEDLSDKFLHQQNLETACKGTAVGDEANAAV